MGKSKYEKEMLSLLEDIQFLESKFPNIKNRKINIFEAAGLTKQEIRHSKVLAFFLSPNQNHGFGDMFFKKMVTSEKVIEFITHMNSDIVPSALNLMLSDYDDLVVRNEDMQIDILMWSPSTKLVVALENKVGASEGKNQLETYRKKITADSRFTGYKKLLIYLTPEGDSGSDEKWIPISYKQILDSLESLKVNSKPSDENIFFVNNYIELIRRYILNEVDEEFKTACDQIYEKHKEILDQIYKNINLSGAKAEAIDRFKLENHNSIKVNEVKDGWLSFTPKNLYENMKDFDLTRTYQRQNKPVVFFFELREDRVKLVIEVGPLKDLVYRNQLVKLLFKELLGQEKSAKSDVYTRIIIKQDRLDPNTLISDLTEEEIFEKMKDLYRSVENYIPKIQEVILELDKQRE